jgi:hypothetical protein
MKAWYEYRDWVHPTNNKRCLVGKKMEAILYVLYDLPCFFSKAKLEIFLGVAINNHNVKRALQRMIERGMLICKRDRNGTDQYYLGNFGMTLLRRQVPPDTNNRPNEFLPSIKIRTDDRLTIINGRRDTTTSKCTASDHPPKVTPPAKKHKSLPKLTLSSSSEEEKEDNNDNRDKYKEDIDNDNDNIMPPSKVGLVNEEMKTASTRLHMFQIAATPFNHTRVHHTLIYTSPNETPSMRT